jgi:uroporphyrin-III C-methyltransferase
VGEEILYFRSHGFEPLVIPGVSSALAGLTFAGMSITQRGVAESFVVCTGVGRNGKEVKLPGYDRGRTLVILMGLTKLGTILSSLLKPEASFRRDGLAYPPHTPIAIVERASLPDQRIVESTLDRIETAIQYVGDQRPPAMLIIGWTVPALWGKGAINHLDENPEGDAESVMKWLDADTGWRIRDGLPEGWRDI